MQAHSQQRQQSERQCESECKLCQQRKQRSCCLCCLCCLCRRRRRHQSVELAANLALKQKRQRVCSERLATSAPCCHCCRSSSAARPTRARVRELDGRARELAGAPTRYCCATSRHRAAAGASSQQEIHFSSRRTKRRPEGNEEAEQEVEEEAEEEEVESERASGCTGNCASCRESEDEPLRAGRSKRGPHEGQPLSEQSGDERFSKYGEQLNNREEFQCREHERHFAAPAGNSVDNQASPVASNTSDDSRRNQGDDSTSSSSCRSSRLYGGESARCNCAGRRRPTLAGLIELFEQQVRVVPRDGDAQPPREQHHQQHSSWSRRQQSKSKHKQEQQQRECANTCECAKVSACERENESKSKMRGIITPVKWEPSDETASSSSDSSSMALDSLAGGGGDGGGEQFASFDDDSHVAGATARTHEPNARRDEHEEHATLVDGDSLECRPERDIVSKARGDQTNHATGCGGRALCCCARHKAPATNNREHRRRNHQPGASPIERIVSCGAVRVLPPKSSSLHKKLTRTHWQAPTDARKYEAQLPKSSLKKSSATSKGNAGGKWCTSGSTWGAPQVVKHQASSSRRLLKQLAALRSAQASASGQGGAGALSTATASPYRTRRRPESAARIEELIEQLERVARHWDEDEHLLDRAARRDFLAQLERRKERADKEKMQATSVPGISKREELAVDELATHEHLLNFGCRDEIPSLEALSIERSHSRSARGLGKAAAAPPPDERRRRDDLAVRRLTPYAGASSRASSPPKASYLLCANASGTPEPIKSPAPVSSLERRLRQDDLHLRRVARSSRHLAPVSPELPFGIPRDQSTQQLARLSTSERLAAAAGGTREHAPPESRFHIAQQEATSSGRRDHFLGSECCDYECQSEVGDSERLRPPSEHHEKADDSRLQPKYSEPARVATTTTIKTTKTTTMTTLTKKTTMTRMTQTHEDEREESEHLDSTQSEPREITRHPQVAVARGTGDTEKRSESRVSFAGDLEEAPAAESGAGKSRSDKSGAGRASADSGLGANSPMWASSRAPSAQSPLEAAPYESFDGDEDDPELDLDFELALCSPPPAGSESPLEIARAELAMTPVRRRPRIKIDTPRAKSPLLRVGSMRGRRARKPATGASSHETWAASKSGQSAAQTGAEVVIQTYGDSTMKRMRNDCRQSRRSVCEIECQYRFSSDEDEAEDALCGAGTTKRLVTTHESSDSSPNDGAYGGTDDDAAASLRLLDSAIEGDKRAKPISRPHKVRTTAPAHKTANEPVSGAPASQCPARGIRPRSRAELIESGAPKFSIGQYRTLDRRQNLIIL